MLISASYYLMRKCFRSISYVSARFQPFFSKFRLFQLFYNKMCLFLILRELFYCFHHLLTSARFCCCRLLFSCFQLKSAAFSSRSSAALSVRCRSCSLGVKVFLQQRIVTFDLQRSAAGLGSVGVAGCAGKPPRILRKHLGDDQGADFLWK